MSNPYGGGYPSYQPGPNPFEPGPYGYPGPAPKRYDGLSVAALVCSLTCCAAPVGIGLAVAGLVRTSGGKRAGRWAAVTGLVVGIIGTLALVGVVVGLVWFGSQVVNESDAEAGQCVDTTSFSDEIDLWKADCASPHDAEIAVAGTFDPAEAAAYGNDRIAFCRDLVIKAGLRDLLASAEYEVGASTDAFSENSPHPGDGYACLILRSDGEQLYEHLLDGRSGQPVADEAPEM